MKVECEDCKYAEWDYETFYNTKETRPFICGCKKDAYNPDGECEEYSMVREEEW